ncbi:site-specific DNA-methyltransferase [Silanimonas sp.]|uniref:site-specific DNA-methyltransferase n=1 Tax=Silanimonas sp. TaxID=1929290 RepID=UPI001BC71B69|nr:site-specific DNA-methyltransferase [Silanimonas sp.]MBS3895943.1 site-specific DNA-methyltransferase [Silanimonas sp.]MBS3924866.1 site-specific DNA-methyltransferase [Xanthomonadaceae bacterium]
MPTLNWIGKDAVVKHHKDVPFRLLEPVPALSCGEPDSGNLIVQGDNLLALKALLPRYAGQVKCIYIDPPYNTGIEEWRYNDNVNSPEIRRWLGEVVGKEGETLDRHDRWLCMMYPRLMLLKQFLRDDGAIFVSIDDNEVANLRLLMDEVFGERNFIEIFSRVKTETPSNLSSTTKKKVEYVVAYGNAKKIGRLVGLRTTSSSSNGLLNQPNEIKVLRFPAGVVRTKIPDGIQRARVQKTQKYEVELLNDVEVRGGLFVGEFALKARFKWSQPVLDEAFRDPSYTILIPTEKLSPAYERSEYEASVPANLIDSDIDSSTNEDATAELAGIFRGDAVFDYPKPVNLVRYLANMLVEKDSLVLDSFGGSGTTAHAVLKQNAEDGGNRRFILVEMDEGIARNVTAERVRRVAQGYTNAKGEAVPGLGGGFQFCTLGKPLFDARGHINNDVRFAELARFVWFMETGMGLPAARASRKAADTASPLLGVHEGRAVYLLYNGILKDRRIDGGNVLTTPLLEHLPAHDGPRVVYGARCAIGPERLRALGIVFKQLPYHLRLAP